MPTTKEPTAPMNKRTKPASKRKTARRGADTPRRGKSPSRAASTFPKGTQAAISPKSGQGTVPTAQRKAARQCILRVLKTIFPYQVPLHTLKGFVQYEGIELSEGQWADELAHLVASGWVDQTMKDNDPLRLLYAYTKVPPAASKEQDAAPRPSAPVAKPLPDVVANRLPGPNEWPRAFGVPGIAFGYCMRPEAVLERFAVAVMALEDELHAMAADLAASRPHDVAAFAEMLAVSEELASSFGYPTDLDETPIGGLSKLRRFASHAKTHALLKPSVSTPVAPATGTGSAAFRVQFIYGGEDGDLHFEKQLPFVPAVGQEISLGGDFWTVESVWWAECGLFECNVVSAANIDLIFDRMLKAGWTEPRGTMDMEPTNPG